MKPQNFDIQELISDLQGTCKSIQEFLPEGMDEDDLTQEDYDTIDQEIFLCAQCGWWCEICESHDKDGENICDNCSEDEE